MKKGLGNVKIASLGHDELLELHYHTWIITSGSHQFMFHGAKSSLGDAIESIQYMTNSPFKPKVKKVA